MAMSFDAITTRIADTAKSIMSHKKQVLIGIAGVVFVVMAGVGYSYYRGYAQAQAHKAFVDALRYFDAAVSKDGKTVITETSIQFATETEKWAKVEEIFRKGYADHKRSGLASMFRAYQADALYNLNKRDEAIQTLEAAVKAMPSEQLQDFYRLKLALLKLDATNHDVQKAGFADLKKMSETPSNIANDGALYYIGMYFWSQKDYAQAKNYWQQLMVKYGMKEGKDKSPFTELAKEKLKLISAEW